MSTTTVVKGSTFITVAELRTINCGNCGGIYAIQVPYFEQKRQEGSSWNCPYCRCGWGFAGNGENSQLKRQLEAAEREKRRLESNVQWQEQKRREAMAEAEHFRRSRDGMKGALRKVKVRIGHGVCPCCNRRFENLRRHMESKHPEVKAGIVEAQP